MENQNPQVLGASLPILEGNLKLDLRLIRDKRERLYFVGIVAFNVFAFSLLSISLIVWPQEAIQFVFVVLLALILDWIAWKVTFPSLYGNSVRIGPNQYPHLYRIFRAASDSLGVREPILLVLNGNGLLALLLAKRFTRRGVVVITSNLLDALRERSSSRELMMIIGAHLGHLAAGHYSHWFFTDFVGTLAIGLHAAWKRRCQHTADRVGLLLAGDVFAAEQALLTVTVGNALAAGTDTREVVTQREELYDNAWTWVRLLFQSDPYILDRILDLRRYGATVRAMHTASPSSIGAVELRHDYIRSISVFIIHGHDRLAVLELKNFLFAKFPRVAPIVLAEDALAAATIPEKLEIIAEKAIGAIALLTPDDRTVEDQIGTNAARSRQNVVLEIGWFWARLGRPRCLLLRKGSVEMPSDLAGIEYQQFTESPVECSESIRSFLESLDNDRHPRTIARAKQISHFEE